MTIEADRIQVLNDGRVDERKPYVLYWMQASQRAAFNPALEYAITRANALGVACVVGFGLMGNYPEANARHYQFMLEGLADARLALQARGIQFVIRRGVPWQVALTLADRSAMVVCDRGYLRHQATWRQQLARALPVQLVQVEGDVCVPVNLVSNKSEYAARTIRPKIHRHLDAFIAPLPERKVDTPSLDLALDSDFDLTDLQTALALLDVDHSVTPVARFTGGNSEARKRLSHFLRAKLDGYAKGRSEPADGQQSTLSPYLHFGQISPVEAVYKCRQAIAGTEADRETFVEELVVRRELAFNFVTFEDHYDDYECLPPWARTTLAEHRNDERPEQYQRSELEAAQTHDPYWNAAMGEMLKTGFMHNYMRMYWGKKILEWSKTPQAAYKTTLHLNNKYFLDGRDPNSYGNVGWIYGLHDRAWTERPIFGKIRYMNANGLKRKFDIERYVEWVDSL